MARIPSDSEITAEAQRIGGGNDFFAARDRLQHRFDEADRALSKLKPVVSETDAVNWAMEPTADQILFEAKQFGLTNETARENLRAKLAVDAKRLASFSATASDEISAALAEAEEARERAATILAEHEAALSAVTTGIFAVGNIRKKISAVQSLRLSADAERQLAKTALDFWVDQKTTSETVQNVSGFRAYAEDLSWRRSLNAHIAEYVAPLEKQAATLIASVRAQATESKMDLRKVFSLLASERGQRGGDSLLLASDFYAGLL